MECLLLGLSCNYLLWINLATLVFEEGEWFCLVLTAVPGICLYGNFIIFYCDVLVCIIVYYAKY